MAHRPRTALSMNRRPDRASAANHRGHWTARGWTRFGVLLHALLACASAALGASRGLYGGTARVAYAGPRPDADPALADAPAEATLLRLATQGLCHLGSGERIEPVLGTEFSQPNPRTLRIVLSATARFAGGKSLTAQDIGASWARLSDAKSLSPYRALLFPIRAEGAPGSMTALPQSVMDLPLAFPWPDLPKSLCHPALAVRGQSSRVAGIGPFSLTSSPEALESNLHFPRGRAYLDRIKVLAGTSRNALRIYSLKEAEILLGQPGEGFHPEAVPALFATYLAFSPAKVGDGFRSAFESSLDRTNLAQFFARGSSVPMQSLLPPDLMPQAQSSAGPIPTTAPSLHPLTLLYDLSLPEQRSVAERVQVKLHDRGYRISLKGLARTDLRARWASGQFDLMLHGLLLPPQPAAALAVVIDAAGRHDLLSTELPPLGAESDRLRRDARARDRAMALAGQLNLIPLYAQSISISFAPELKNLAFDAYGLPEMENAFFSGEGG